MPPKRKAASKKNQKKAAASTPPPPLPPRPPTLLSLPAEIHHQISAFLPGRARLRVIRTAPALVQPYSGQFRGLCVESEDTDKPTAALKRLLRRQEQLAKLCVWRSSMVPTVASALVGGCGQRLESLVLREDLRPEDAASILPLFQPRSRPPPSITGASC